MSLGPQRLARFLQQTNLSQAEAARRARAGLHRSHLSHWLAGRRVPTLEQAVALEQLTTSWSEGPIRPSEWIALKSVA